MMLVILDIVNILRSGSLVTRSSQRRKKHKTQTKLVFKFYVTNANYYDNNARTSHKGRV